MKTLVRKKDPADENEINTFLKRVDFELPEGFISLYRDSNGIEIFTEERYVSIYKIEKVFEMNAIYQIESELPGFFSFGTNGSDAAYTIEKATGYIFETPYIGISKEESILMAENFNKFLENL